MAEETQEAEVAETEGNESSGGKGKLLMVVAAVVAALGIGAGGTFLIVGGSAEHAEEGEEAEGDEAAAEEEAEDEADEEAAEAKAKAAATAASGGGEFFPLETFIVNINDGRRDRFLKIKTELEVSDEAVVLELRARMPQVKDLVITLLSSGSVRKVFFTEFVVQ
jgi:flagellar FliL protein